MKATASYNVIFSNLIFIKGKIAASEQIFSVLHLSGTANLLTCRTLIWVYGTSIEIYDYCRLVYGVNRIITYHKRIILD